jgi:hypothetical protein
VQATPSPARLSIIAAPLSLASQRARFASPARSTLQHAPQSPVRGLGEREGDDIAKGARRRAEEAAAAQRRASSSYAAVRLPRAAPRPGTAMDAAAAAAAGEVDVLVLFGRRWLPVRGRRAGTDPRVEINGTPLVREVVGQVTA